LTFCNALPVRARVGSGTITAIYYYYYYCFSVLVKAPPNDGLSTGKEYTSIVAVAADVQSSVSAMSPAEQSAISCINQTIAEANELHTAVEQFTGADKSSKQFRYLEEMLTRLLLRLDGVDSAGVEGIRTMRKDAIVSIQAILDQLELKVIAG